MSFFMMVITQITMRGHTTDEQQTQHQASKLLIYFDAKTSKREVETTSTFRGFPTCLSEI